MVGTDLVATKDLVRQNQILQTLKPSFLTHGLAEEEVEKVKQQWASGGTAGDRAVVQAIEACEQGRQLVDLYEVIARGGVSKKYTSSQMPALTVAPPFAKNVNMRVFHDGEMRLSARRWKMTLPSGYTFSRSSAISYSGIATVPAMPPEVRGVAKKDHLVLWEPAWTKISSKIERPPMNWDPALLEHLSGNLYLVVATWDLTPLEAAALA